MKPASAMSLAPKKPRAIGACLRLHRAALCCDGDCSQRAGAKEIAFCHHVNVPHADENQVLTLMYLSAVV
jgi:hypothetical protein